MVRAGTALREISLCLEHLPAGTSVLAYYEIFVVGNRLPALEHFPSLREGPMSVRHLLITDLQLRLDRDLFCLVHPEYMDRTIPPDMFPQRYDAASWAALVCRLTSRDFAMLPALIEDWGDSPARVPPVDYSQLASGMGPTQDISEEDLDLLFHLTLTPASEEARNQLAHGSAGLNQFTAAIRPLL